MPIITVVHMQQYAQIVSPLITAITLIFVIVNVNRTQRKSKQNDEEKFNRDLNLKASDEMIEVISSLRQKSGHYLLQNNMRDEIKDDHTLKLFIQHIDDCINLVEVATMALQTRFFQRKIIMNKYDSDIESIFIEGFEISSELLQLKKWHTIEVGHTDQEIERVENNIVDLVIDITEKLNNLQTNILNEFFGELYNKRV